VAGAYTGGSFAATKTNGRLTDPAQAANGVIPHESPWRQLLEDTERALGLAGWSVFLPHREVSRWGSREITPGEVAAECLSAVALSDAVLAILGESFGTHVEVGMALGLGIPTVVVRSKQKTESYFDTGVADSGFVAPLILSDLRECLQLLRPVGL
jgi:nucleoside 2-deoxyribosyltransferase